MALDIKGILGPAVSAGLDLAGQATKTATFVPDPSEQKNYDPASGTFISGENSAPIYQVTALVYQSRDQKLAEDASKTATLIVQTDDLIQAGYGDPVTESAQFIIDGVTWFVTRADVDPAGVIWIVQVRK